MAFDALYRRAHAGERGGVHASQGARNAGFAAHAIEQPASRASGRDWVIAAQGLKNGLAFRNLARLIFTSLYRLAPRVVNALVIVKPETVIRWHTAPYPPSPARSDAGRFPA